MAGAIKPLLSWGGSVVLLPNFEPRRFLKTLSEYRCTNAGAVPAVFTLLLQDRDLISRKPGTTWEFTRRLGPTPPQEKPAALVGTWECRDDKGERRLTITRRRSRRPASRPLTIR